MKYCRFLLNHRRSVPGTHNARCICDGRRLTSQVTARRRWRHRSLTPPQVRNTYDMTRDKFVYIMYCEPGQVGKAFCEKELACCQVALQFVRVIAIVVCRFLISKQCLSIGESFKRFFRERYCFLPRKYACVTRCLPFL